VNTVLEEAPLPTVHKTARENGGSVAVRLFLTCWLVYALHVATNTVREIYPALSIADHLSFRVDEYAGMHPDLFEKPGFGWHINSNPGASMIAAIPYAVVRPLVDHMVAEVNRRRAASGATAPEYRSPWPMAREFYRRAWSRGLDIKFGLAAVITQALCMAPISAAGAVVMFLLLRRLLRSDAVACWLGLLYAFGTPVFFRTGYLNHNLILGHCAFVAFVVLWRADVLPALPERWRCYTAGFLGGMAVLLDYSGIIVLGTLFLYVLLTRAVRRSHASRLYILGSLGPLGILWFYQWTSFGHPFYPAQHWMAPVEWINEGYQGVSLPQAGMLFANAFDYRYGLFTSCPMLLLGLGAWLLSRRLRMIPDRELAMCFGFSLALLLFAGSVHYSKLQFNTGIRYLVPAVPFLFLPVTVVLMRLPRRFAALIGVISIAQAWCMAMYRDVELGAGVLEPLLRVFLDGFQLPALTVLSRLGNGSPGGSPLSLFALAAAVLFVIWSKKLSDEGKAAL
jgi:hypothetical protein